MRTIKFRAWDKQSKEMLQPSFPVGAKYGVGFEIECDSYKSNEDMVFMQFTGLLDKNGVEVFEGDVVRFEVENPNMWGGKTSGCIFWDSDKLCWAIQAEGNIVSIGHGYDAYPGSLEVIGNIYERPNLLEEQPNSANRRH